MPTTSFTDPSLQSPGEPSVLGFFVIVALVLGAALGLLMFFG